MENLECPICLELADDEDPYECITCAAIICGKHLEGIKRKCPLCRSENAFKSSAIAKKLLKKAERQCDYCTFKGVKAVVTEHESICPNKPLKCHICNETSKGEDFIDHIKNKHLSIVLNTFISEYSKETNQNMLFENKSNILKHSYDIQTCQTSLYASDRISMKIKIKNTKNISYIVLGFSEKKLHSVKSGYIGANTGPGTWGLAGNGFIGEEGKWVKGSHLLASGDIITLNYFKGKITYGVNNKMFDYSYSFKNENPVYFGCNLYTKGDELEILY